MYLWLLIIAIGGAGCVLFGAPMAMDAVYGAQFKKKSGSVPGVIQRNIKRSLKPFLVSLALLVLGLVLMGVSSARKPPPDPDGVETRVTDQLVPKT